MITWIRFHLVSTRRFASAPCLQQLLGVPRASDSVPVGSVQCTTTSPNGHIPLDVFKRRRRRRRTRLKHQPSHISYLNLQETSPPSSIPQPNTSCPSHFHLPCACPALLRPPTPSLSPQTTASDCAQHGARAAS